MGGAAFSATLKSTSFPRLPPQVYKALKARVVPLLSTFYKVIGVPAEAPEKIDHGDLDLLVTIPKAPYTDAVPHVAIQEALNARFVIPMEGNRTSNYAVPVTVGEWDSYGHGTQETSARELADDGKIFYQVDVHVCIDELEWKRIMFFHSYGDLGMILGAMSRNAGLAWGEKGLKLPDQPYAPLPLSQDMDEILRFFQLPKDRYDNGFSTKLDLFKWVASSPLLNIRSFQADGQGISRVKEERKMYFEFADFVSKLRASGSLQTGGASDADRKITYRTRALEFFNKAAEYDKESKARLDRIRLKNCFSGGRVRTWADLGENWLGVKLIMDTMRERLGGDQGVLQYLDEHGEGALKDYVVNIKDELRVTPKFKPSPDEPLALANVLRKMDLNDGGKEKEK